MANPLQEKGVICHDAKRASATTSLGRLSMPSTERSARQEMKIGCYSVRFSMLVRGRKSNLVDFAQRKKGVSPIQTPQTSQRNHIQTHLREHAFGISFGRTPNTACCKYWHPPSRFLPSGALGYLLDDFSDIGQARCINGTA